MQVSMQAYASRCSEGSAAKVSSPFHVRCTSSSWPLVGSCIRSPHPLSQGTPVASRSTHVILVRLCSAAEVAPLVDIRRMEKDLWHVNIVLLSLPTLLLSHHAGDVIYIYVFGNPTIILNSAQAVEELFEKRGAKYASKPARAMFLEL